MKHICGNTIDLYPLHLDHLESYVHNYSTLIQSLLHVRDKMQELVYVKMRIQEQAFFYGISPKLLLNIIGAIEIRNPVYRSQLYCWLNEKYWSNGYFQEAMYLVSNAYFKQTDHTAITARVDCKNRRSVAALKKVGFLEQKVVPGAYGPQIELLLPRSNQEGN